MPHLLKMLSRIILISALTFSPRTITNLSPVTLGMSFLQGHILKIQCLWPFYVTGISTCDPGCDLIAHYFLLPNNNPFY